MKIYPLINVQEKRLVTIDPYGQIHRFRITNVFSGEIWNIGRENFPFPKFVPLCDTYYNGEPYHINPNSLRAIEVETEEFALFLIDKAHYGKVDRKRYNQLHKEFFHD